MNDHEWLQLFEATAASYNMVAFGHGQTLLAEFEDQPLCQWSGVVLREKLRSRIISRHGGNEKTVLRFYGGKARFRRILHFATSIAEEEDGGNLQFVSRLIDIVSKKESDPIAAVAVFKTFYLKRSRLQPAILAKLESTATLHSWLSLQSRIQDIASDDRPVDAILSIVKADEDCSDCFKGDNAQSINNFLANIEKAVHARSAILEKYNDCVDAFDQKLIQIWMIEFSKKNKAEHLAELVAVVMRAIYLKFKFWLRNTQLFTLSCFLLNDSSKTLAQVATGEGKTAIVLALACVKCLLSPEMTVDIVTSSSVLAVRDAKEQAGVYNLFNISVAHNDHESVDKRKEAYACRVVYGEASAFQRDLLRHEFYGENIRGARRQTCVIVDEVDSMLLDKGNNVLYLSHNLPDFDKLEGIYIYIWLSVTKYALNQAGTHDSSPAATIRQKVLNCLYRSVSKQFFTSILGNEREDMIDQLWIQLANAKVISHDSGNILVENDQLDDKIPRDCFCRDEILFALRRVTMAPREFEAPPRYLWQFVKRHLDAWIASAFQALNLANKRDYVLSNNHDDHNEPNIVIVDRDTGTDQVTSQWSEALHQFLQLKHGCRLSVQSLKAIFMSNTKFFSSFINIFGLTGTLGSQAERRLLERLYAVNHVTVPTSRRSRFVEYDAILCENAETHVSTVVEQALKVATDPDSPRSVLIICETIEESNTFAEALRRSLSSKNETKVQLSIYQRDYEKFTAAEITLGPGHVIVATNLAGRGADLKITDELDNNGGVHVCLTYLPSNKRVEKQAYGRAARKGNRGSGQMVLNTDLGEELRANDDDEQEIFEFFIEYRDKREAERIAEIEEYYRKFIAGEEHLFDAFREKYFELKQALQNRVEEPMRQTLLTCCLDKWALWLDQASGELSHFKQEQDSEGIVSALEIRLQSDLIAMLQKITKLQNVDNGFSEIVNNIDSPSSLVKLGLNYATTGSNADLAKASICFEQVIKKEPDCAEFAYYYQAVVILKQHREFGDKIVLRRRLKQSLQQSLRAFEDKQFIELRYASYISEISLLVFEGGKTKRLAAANFYHQQKITSHQLYGLFIATIHNMLGTHVISAEHFDVSTAAKNLSQSAADEVRDAIFMHLIDTGIVKRFKLKCNLNDDDLQVTSATHGLDAKKFKDYLQQQAAILDEKNGERHLKAHFPEIASRETFWKILRQFELIEMEEVVVLIKKETSEESSILTEIKKAFDGNAKHLAMILNRSLAPQDRKQLLLCPHFDNSNGEYYVYDKKLLKEKFKLAEWRTEKRRGNVIVNKAAFVATDRLRTFDFMHGTGISPFRLHEHIFSAVYPRFISHDKSRQIFKRLVEFDVISSDGDLIKFADLNDSAEAARIFGHLSAYLNEVWTVLQSCFAYKIQFAAMVHFFNQPSDNIIPFYKLSLPYKPHRQLFGEIAVNSNIYVPYRLNKKTFSQIDRLLTHEEVMKFIKKAEKKTENNRNGKQQSATITKESIRDIVESTKGLYGVLSRSAPAVALKPLREMLSAEERVNFANELSLLTINGADHVVVIEEKRHTIMMRLNCAGVFLLGVAQIAAGITLQLYTMGIGTQVAAGLIFEGLNDIAFAAESARTGYFSWREYATCKLLSLAFTVVTFAIGAFCSPVAAFSRFGNLLGMPELCGNALIKTASESVVKEAAVSMGKLVFQEIGIEIGRGLLNGAIRIGTAIAVERCMKSLVGEISESIVSKVYKAIDRHSELKKTIALVFSKMGGAASAYITDKVDAVLKKDWFGSKMGRILGTIGTKALAEFSAFVKKKITSVSSMRPLAELVASVISLSAAAVKLASIATMMRTFLDELCKDLKSNLNVNVSDKVDADAETFQRNMDGVLRTMIKDRFSQEIRIRICEPLMRESVGLLALYGTFGCQMAHKKAVEWKLNRDLNRAMSDLASAEKTSNGGSGDSSSIEVARRDFQKKLIELQIRSNGPAFHARLIREGAQVDFATVQACANVEQRTIVIVDEASGQERFVFTPAQKPGGEAIQRDPLRIVFDNACCLDSGGAFFSNNCHKSAINSQCFYNAVAGGEEASLLRQRVAEHMVKTEDSRIHHLLSGYQNRFQISQGFIGGSSPTSREKYQNLHMSSTANIGQQTTTLRKAIDNTLRQIDIISQPKTRAREKNSAQNRRENMGRHAAITGESHLIAGLQLHQHSGDSLEGLYSVKIGTEQIRRHFSTTAKYSGRNNQQVRLLLEFNKTKRSTIFGRARVIGVVGADSPTIPTRPWPDIVRRNQQSKYLPIRTSNGHMIGVPRDNCY